MSQAASVHTVTVPVTVSGIGPYVPDPPTTLLLDLAPRPDLDPALVAEAEEIIARARAEASEAIDEARATARDLQEAAETALVEARSKADEIVEAAGREAADLEENTSTRIAELMEAAEREISSLRSDAAASVEALRAESESDRAEAGRERQEATDARLEAETVLAEAREAAAQLVADAQAAAERIIETAHQDGRLEAGRIRDGAESELLTSLATAEERVKDLEAVHQIELATLAEREAEMSARIRELESLVEKAFSVPNGHVATKAPEPAGQDIPTASSMPARGEGISNGDIATDPPSSPWFVPDDEDEAADTDDGSDAPDVSGVESDRELLSEAIANFVPPERDADGHIRPAQTLVEPLRPQVFRATATEPNRKKRKRRK